MMDGGVACSLQLVERIGLGKDHRAHGRGFKPPPKHIPKRMQILQQSQPGSLKKHETRLRWQRQQYNCGQGISPPIPQSLHLLNPLTCIMYIILIASRHACHWRSDTSSSLYTASCLIST